MVSKTIEGFRQRHLKLARMAFLDGELMNGTPQFTYKNFRTPQLRRCSFDPDTVIFEARLGGGADGYVWKVWFGERGPFALKMFWDQTPPQAIGTYYALQRECQNSAVIQMMRESISSYPVQLLQNPEGKEEAEQNFFAFCQENSDQRRESGITENEIPADHKLISSAPRVVECYGWLKLQSYIWDKLPRHLQAPHLKIDKTERYMEKNQDYISLVYEYIEEGENTPSKVEEVDDFLYHAGFAYTLAPLAKNWVNSVLVDQSDIVFYGGYGWRANGYRKRSAGQILKR
ncbi:hypothetical protein V8C37DRAFT_394597 [Trichoderma ceciliae]